MAWKHWDTLTTKDFSALDPARTIAIMPVGSIEQHGPHLPLSVDIRLAEGVLAETLRQAADDSTLLVLPGLPVGKATEHEKFKGTLSLSAATLIAMWTEIGESVRRAGVRKLMILNGHGGQTQVMDIVARELRVRHGMLVVPVNWWSVRAAPTVFSEEEYTYGIHGGAEETSMMMHLHPDLVRTAHLSNFVPASLAQKDKFPMLYGAGVRHAWQAGDLHPEGAMGDATKATAAHGKAIIEDAAKALARLLSEMAVFELPQEKKN